MKAALLWPEGSARTDSQTHGEGEGCKGLEEADRGGGWLGACKR